MTPRTPLGRRFRWLWTAYALSTYGTGFGFAAFSYIAIRTLGASASQVSVLTASGLAVGAVLAVPLGPWVEFRAKRPVMIGMDLIRFVALLSIPIAYWLGVLTFAQLVVVSVIVAAAKIAFTAASGAYLKALVPAEDLLVANSRFESTTWSAMIFGPTLGGAAMGLLGPVVTVAVDAASYLLSALGITAIGGSEPPPPAKAGRLRLSDLLEGWRYILRHATLRPLFFNILLVNGLIMATEPLLAYLMLGRLGFPAWQYGFAFAIPCIGGLIGSRLARPVVARFGQSRVLRTVGSLRAGWSIGLVLVRPGLAGLLIVIGCELGLIISCSLFNPVATTYRLEHTEPHLLARVISAWSVSTSTSIAALTALWGLLAALTSARFAIGAAGVLMLVTPLLLRRFRPANSSTSPARSEQAARV